MSDTTEFKFYALFMGINYYESIQTKLISWYNFLFIRGNLQI